MRDAQMERFVRGLGGTWEFRPSQDPSAVDWANTGLRQVRLNGTDQDLIDSYALMMMDAADFPGVWVLDQEGKLFGLAGFHRGPAAIIAKRPLDFYVVPSETDPAIVQLIRRAHNILNGRRDSKEDIIEQAVILHRESGLTVEQAARVQGLGPEVVARRIRAGKERQELEENHISARTVDRLSLLALDEIHRIPRLAHRLRLAAMAADQHLTADERHVTGMALRKVDSDAEGDRLLDELQQRLDGRKRPSIGGKPTRAIAPIDTLLARMRSLRRYAEAAKLVGVSEARWKEFRDEYDGLNKALRPIGVAAFRATHRQDQAGNGIGTADDRQTIGATPPE